MGTIREQLVEEYKGYCKLRLRQSRLAGTPYVHVPFYHWLEIGAYLYTPFEDEDKIKEELNELANKL